MECSRQVKGQWYFDAPSEQWICKACYMVHERAAKKQATPVGPPTARNTPKPKTSPCPRCLEMTLAFRWQWDKEELRWLCSNCVQRKKRARATWLKRQGERGASEDAEDEPVPSDKAGPDGGDEADEEDQR